MTLLIDLAPRPALPEVIDAMILDSSWVAVVTEIVEPVDAAPRDLQAKSFPPNANELCGQLSRSKYLDRPLREAVDRVALSLQHALDAHDQEPPTPITKPDPHVELAALGIEV
jgi:hypothetical protein